MHRIVICEYVCITLAQNVKMFIVPAQVCSQNKESRATILKRMPKASAVEPLTLQAI